jgi:hypothetical protein
MRTGGINCLMYLRLWDRSWLIADFPTHSSSVLVYYVKTSVLYSRTLLVITILISREKQISAPKYVAIDARYVVAVIVYRSCTWISVIFSTYVCQFYWTFGWCENTLF